MYLILSLILFLLSLIALLKAKKKKRKLPLFFTLVFLITTALIGINHYKSDTKIIDISDSVGSIAALEEKTGLTFEKESSDMNGDLYSADKIRILQKDGKTVYAELSAGSEKYTLFGIPMQDAEKMSLSESGFTVLLIHGADSVIYSYGKNGESLVCYISPDKTCEKLRFYPDPYFAESLILSAEEIGMDIEEFAESVENLNEEKKQEFGEKYIGKLVSWQGKVTSVSSKSLEITYAGEVFKISPLPSYTEFVGDELLDDYVRFTGLFNGRDKTWRIGSCILDTATEDIHETEKSLSRFAGTYKAGSNELVITVENGMLYLRGSSNYGAFPAEGNLREADEDTFYYNESEGDFYITFTESGAKVTTDTLVSFEGMYTKS